MMQSVILTDQRGAGVKGDEKGETRAGKKPTSKRHKADARRSTEEMEVKLSRVLARWSPAIHTLCAPVS